MADRIAEIVVLAEDLRQFNLIRRYLERNHKPGTIRPVLAPKGRGSGEQFVRNKYPGEVKEYRNRASKRKAALVVVIDADTNTVTQHQEELAATLTAIGGGDRQARECIALLVPRRNIETWICCLLCEQVDETSDFKNRRRDIDQEIGQAADILYDWTRPNYPVPNKCVESLRQAIEKELPRIS